MKKNDNSTKYCYKCKQYKSLSNNEFHKNKYKKDGYSDECKFCCKEYRKTRQLKQKESHKKYRENNKEKIRKCKQNWYNKNKDRLLKENKKRYIQNKEEYLKSNKLYKKKNKEKLKETYEKEKYKVEYIAKRLFNHAKNRTNIYNKNNDIKINFNITYEWVLEQVINIKKCPILNIDFVLSNKIIFGSRNLDRINTNNGYTIDNTILVSNLANTIKNNGSVDDLEKLYFYMEKISKLEDKSWEEKFKIFNLEEQKIIINLNKGKDYFIKKNISFIIYRRARNRSKVKNIEFSLEESDIIIPKTCPILRIPIFVGKGKCCNNSPSIDRIDNNKGYTKNNIQIISHKANTMKNCASLEEIKKVYFGYKKILSKKF